MKKFESEIKARNKANLIYQENIQGFMDVIRPFVGKKIRLQSKQLSSAFRKAIEMFKTLNISVTSSDYSLEFAVKAWEPYTNEEGGVYRNANVYFTIEDGILIDFNPVKYQGKYTRTNYELHELLDAQKDLEDAKEALSIAIHKLNEINY